MFLNAVHLDLIDLLLPEELEQESFNILQLVVSPLDEDIIDLTSI